jgi:hypothetical protein
MPRVPGISEMLIKVNTHDHGPAHVHAFTGSGEVIILIPQRGEARLREAQPGVTKSDVSKALGIVNENIGACRRTWRQYHGEASDRR